MSLNSDLTEKLLLNCLNILISGVLVNFINNLWLYSNDINIFEIMDVQKTKIINIDTSGDEIKENKPNIIFKKVIISIFSSIL